MRPLTLHASALNDDEYASYTSILKDLAWVDDSGQPHDDVYYEQITISLRETRGWLRGRYCEVSPATIDSVCFGNERENSVSLSSFPRFFGFSRPT